MSRMFPGAYSLTYVPVYARTVEEFSAPDPWNGDRPARWTLDVFRMVNSKTEKYYLQMGERMPQQSQGGRLGMLEVLGVRNAAEGRPRTLPRGLAMLWQEQRVATEDLPRLMAKMERQLLTSDYFSQRALFWKWPVSLFLAGALGMFVVSGLTLGTPEHALKNRTAAEWLQRPVTPKQDVNVVGAVALDGTVPAGKVELPPGVTGQAEGNLLGWYRAAEGERLVLLAPAYKQGTTPGGAAEGMIFGAVLPVPALHLSPAVLAAAKAQSPDVQTDFIACSGWTWSDGHRVLGEDPRPWLGSAAFFLLLAGIFYAQHRSRERRVLKLKEEFASLL